MGLLDQFLGSPDQTQALGLLGIGLMNRNFGGGAQAAMQHMAGADERRIRKSLLDAQLSETLAQAEERKARTAEMARRNAMISQYLGSGGIGAPEVSPGAFQPSPSQAGPMGPTLPPEMAGRSAPGSRLASLGFDELMGLKMAGVDLTDLHKYANDPLKLEQGSTYESRVTGKREYIPKVGEGIAPDAHGFYAPLPGYIGSVGQIKGAEAGAQEAAKANLDLVKVVGPDGAERWAPRAQVAGARPAQPQRGGFTTPGDGDRYAILSQELAKARSEGRAGDVSALEREIGRLPPEARTMPSQSGLAGGFQASPTTAQATDAAAAKVRAEAEARAAVERDTGKQKKSDAANDMLSSIQRARTLLQMDPTGSLAGAAVDKVMGLAGMTTSSSNTATALETLSGWLVANTPRMEGPQSNYDVENYKVMAGRIGDRTVPPTARLAALDEVERIQRKYSHLNAETPKSNVQTFDDLPPARNFKGKVATNPATGQKMRSNGLTWEPM